MTTIAYKDGVIASDSRLTSGSTITSDSSNKRYMRHGVSFFMCGHKPDYEPFIDAYFDGRRPKEEVDAEAFVVDGGQVFRAGAHKGELWVQPAIDPSAIGSGSQHALTAMDMGATAAEAVKMAIKRDTGTGGRVRVCTVK